MKLKINIYLLLLVCSYSYGQIDEYNYKRELQGIIDQWHKVELPNELFGKVSSNLSDIRIFGITTDNDTIEAPYLLRILTEKTASKEVNFKTINSSHNEKGYYFTFKIATKESINQIRLGFKQDNFDWKIILEGSQNQQEWFHILDNYRILSIRNEQTDYQFTNITFPDSNYRYFRLLINSKNKPELKTTKITFHEVSGANLRKYTIRKVKINEKRSAKQTVIDIDLENPVPVSILKFNMENTFDYYRPITIKYLTDSVKTEQGWHYNYNTLSSGTLSSIEKNKFKFNSTTLQKLKIIIHNHDNEPLLFKNLEVKGYTHELIARFTKPAKYYLTYGNSITRKPNYDLNHLTTNISDSLTTLTLKNEQIIDKKEAPTVEPLFKNKIWLWAIMTIIILLLGWFSLKMIRKG
ncbi:MAG: DUF3999 family protein [Flavobacteriaceae bacterium]|nr:DUF3999 family protein [Flavobacteriaceae bacterium]